MPITKQKIHITEPDPANKCPGSSKTEPIPGRLFKTLTPGINPALIRNNAPNMPTIMLVPFSNKGRISGTVQFRKDKPKAFIGYNANCDRPDETTFIDANRRREFTAYLKVKTVLFLPALVLKQGDP